MHTPTYKPMIPPELVLQVAEHLASDDQIQFLQALPFLKVLFPRKLILAQDQTEEGNTLLHILAKDGNSRLLNSLLTHHNVPADISNKSNRTPLSIAAEHGRLSVIKLLLTRFDVNPDSERSGGSSGKTPLAWAADKGHVDIVKYLLEETPTLSDRVDNCSRTPLIWAVNGGHEAVVEELVRQDNCRLAASINADDRELHNTDPVGINAQDEDGYTALLLAVTDRYPGIVRALLTRADLDVNKRYAGTGRTALSMASAVGNLEIVQQLLRREDVDVNLPDANGWPPVLWASKQAHTEIIRLLESRGATKAKYYSDYVLATLA
ncbi:ankyrin repeat-containing domain protein [Aspergillus aurantiobrunneus]